MSVLADVGLMLTPQTSQIYSLSSDRTGFGGVVGGGGGPVVAICRFWFVSFMILVRIFRLNFETDKVVYSVEVCLNTEERISSFNLEFLCLTMSEIEKLDKPALL